MKTLPLSEVKAKLNRLVDEVHERDEEIVITKNGRPTAVLLSVDEVESWKESLAIRSDQDFMEEIRQGLKDLRAKKARLYTLEDLFKN
ncbi:MAG: prevent-host-death protein [Nitrospirae bacterium RBG_16_64_22]|nr:MAG: prevent-host-death protein [Nitrospirae bacterium RBG_16_64_22]